MKDTIKAIFTISVPVFVIATIFNVTILKAYADGKKLGQSRSPAVVTKTASLKTNVNQYLQTL